MPYRDSVTRFFASGYLHESVSPNPEYPIRTVSNFFENMQSQDAPPESPTPVENLPPVSTPAANSPPVLLVLLIVVANLPPVSTTPVEICHRYQ
jgi:hypothetical protein